jgi:hypothetical protein
VNWGMIWGGGVLGGDLGDALGRCPGDTRGMPKVKLIKTHLKKSCSR